MHTLIICTPELKQRVQGQSDIPEQLIWVHDLGCALTQLDVMDIASIVFDLRAPPFESPRDLKTLIANLPVTTRLLAIVKQLPDEDFFSESGVVYLTPPVNLDDVLWFIRSAPVEVQSG